MKVLVDTCIWSLALRRKKQSGPNIELVEFQELIEEVRVQLIGPIRQEILFSPTYHLPQKTLN
jgi:hypothetical protein